MKKNFQAPNLKKKFPILCSDRAKDFWPSEQNVFPIENELRCQKSLKI